MSRLINSVSGLLALLSIANSSLLTFAEHPRDQLFDSDWLFLRGNTIGAEQPAYDDSNWRKLDLPHDWSIEDLPPRQNQLPELEIVKGSWRFHKGDNPDWRARELDDSSWERVTLPAHWEQHSGHTQSNVYGWYRRRLQIPEDISGKDFDLLLGRIDDVDEVWLNGRRIGGTGSFPPNYQSAWETERRYRVPSSLVRGDGSDVLAVRVFDGDGNGGIYAAGSEFNRIGPFDPALSENGDKTGYVLGGVGWYRKHFIVSEPDKHVSVRFDGVYMIADVWINGNHLGMHPHGYTSFEYDLTPYLNADSRENVLAVSVSNEGRNSRWYSGSGIYRHVWLTTTEQIRIPTYGIFVTTPEVSKEKAIANLQVEVINGADSSSRGLVRTRVRDSDGNEVGTSQRAVELSPNTVITSEHTVSIIRPKLWSPDSPALYTAEVEVVVEGKVVDAVSVPFGIRTVEINVERGLRLNGNSLLLKGGCIHHDNGPLGAAAIDRAEERKVELLKDNGFNAIRSSHNPPSPALLEACDRLGLLVINEAFDQWNEHKLDNTEDYSRFFNEWHQRDTASMVRRDRNHPSVIMWSIGNEIPEQFRAEDTQRKLREAVLKHDNTRYVTQAICTDWGQVIQNWDQFSDPAFLHLDVAGYNYLPNKYESDHARHPQRVIYGSESYAKNSFEYWSLTEKNPYIIGDFVWTAMDYLGESGIGHAVLNDEPNPFFMSWPWHNAWCGDLDICGFKKPQSYYRDVVWRESPIEMAVHAAIPEGHHEILSWWGWPNEEQSWNWHGHEGKPLQVSVYSRCERVRLELNGKVIGEKPISEDTKLTATFEVPYASGELRAVAITEGKEVADRVIRTSGEPKAIRLSVDRSTISKDRNDLAYVTVEVVDAQGQRVSHAEVPIQFHVSGTGYLIAQANGAPNKPASFRAPKCTTYRGRCIAILQPTGSAGEITLHAEASELKTATTRVQCR